MENEIQETNNSKKYVFYAVLLVVCVIFLGITATYAFFKVSVSNDDTLANVNATLDCINVSYSESGVISLNDPYPVSDTYALGKTPVTVTVTNNCSANVQNVNYTLALTTLRNATGYIEDSKIRTNVKRKLADASETTIKNTGYLNTLTPLTTGNAYDFLINDLAKRDATKNYPNKTSYVIDSGSVGNGKSNIYKVYLWVDYYEGNAAAYSGNLTNQASFNNTTEGKEFAAALSLIINP